MVTVEDGGIWSKELLCVLTDEWMNLEGGERMGMGMGLRLR